MIRILDRLLLFVYSILIGFCSVIVLLISLEWITNSAAQNYLNLVYTDLNVSIPLIVIGCITLLVSLRFLYISLRRSKRNAPSIDQRTDYGDICISLETIENLSLKSATRIRGVKDLKIKVKISDVGLEILIRTVVDGESPIPQLTEDVQRSVKEYVEEITGIPVAVVSVYVANIIHTNSLKSRVE